MAVRGISSKTPIILSQSGVPVGIPSSGSIGNNGALTLTTAFLSTYSGGIYLYFPANAIASGSAAGLYWTVMSSTTVGTVYNNTYSSGDPTIPASPTAFATTGPGAYTQSTSEITLRANIVPGGMLGLNGSVRARTVWSTNNTAGNKTVRLKFGGSGTAYLSVALASSVSARFQTEVQNRGSASAQVGGPWGATNFGSAAAAAVVTATDNTAIDSSILCTAQLAAATDCAVLESSLHEVLPS